MGQDQADKGPERVAGVAFALREQVQTRIVVFTMRDFPIGDTVLKVILMPLASGLVVVDPLAVEEGDVPLAVVEAEGGAGSKFA